MKNQKLRFVTLLCAIISMATPSEGAPPTAEKSDQAERAKKTKKPKPALVPEVYAATVPKPTLSAISYGPHARNILDFWKAESAQPTPLAFIIHGGGWRGGSKERVSVVVEVERLLKAGISVAAINYRLIGKTVAETPPVKAPLADAAIALQFIRSKAKEWNIEKTRIGAAGSSAGACSSLWLAFHNDLADPKSANPIARESTRLLCAAVVGAQTTLDPQQMKDWTPNSNYGGHAFGYATFADFLGNREKILPWIAEYSPYALVSSEDPPIYLIYGQAPAIGKEQKDPTHTSNFGVKLQEHCVTQKVPCELVYPNAKNVIHPSTTDFLIKMLQKK